MDTSLDILSSRSCVVKASFPNLEPESSACGTVIDMSNGLVLSHGSILTEHVATNKKLLSKVTNGKSLTSSDLPGAVFTLLLTNHMNQDFATQNPLVVESVSSSDVIGIKKTYDDFTPVKCQFLGAIRNKDFHNAMNDLMPRDGWTFNEITSDDDVKNSDQNKKQEINDSYATYNLISYFLVLKFSHSDFKIPKGLFNSSQTSLFKSLKTRGKCHVGDTAEIIATPFASLCPSVFFNAYSRGVISNVSGNKDCWIVTDARCIPGCEGGPLYTKRKPSEATSYLSGIIASSLCWKNNEWIGFAVVCGIDSILESMASYSDIFMKTSYRNTLSSSKSRTLADAHIAQAATVLIQCGGNWGTGVVVDNMKGIILTCSHVIKSADSDAVTVRNYKSASKYPAEVIYRQDPVTAPYDLALVKCLQASRHNLPKDWTIQVSPPYVGDEVLVSGHAVFNTDKGLEPSVCKGVVSKVIKNRNKPALIQTTCAVHGGASGGPLMTNDGCLVGIVVCNTRDSGNNTSFPHVNLCIPMTTVWPIIENYLATGDKQLLSQLQVQDSELKQMWALGTQTSHQIGTHHPRSKL